MGHTCFLTILFFFPSSLIEQIRTTPVTVLHWFSLSFYFLLFHSFLEGFSPFHHMRDRNLKQNWWRTCLIRNVTGYGCYVQNSIIYPFEYQEMHVVVKLSYVREESTWTHKSDWKKKKSRRTINEQWESRLLTILTFALLRGCLPQNSRDFYYKSGSSEEF